MVAGGGDNKLVANKVSVIASECGYTNERAPLVTEGTSLGTNVPLAIMPSRIVDGDNKSDGLAIVLCLPLAPPPTTLLCS